MTHEFTPDWKLSPQDQFAVKLSLSLSKHIPDWPGCTDEQLAAVAAELAPSAPRSTDHEAKAREIWHRITEEASASNFHGVIYDGEKIAEIISAALQEAEEAEREACAKVADNALGYGGVPCKQAAALIRKRSETDE